MCYNELSELSQFPQQSESKMNFKNLRSDIQSVARKYRVYLSPTSHESLFRNMPLDVAYKALADMNTTLRKSRGAEIRALGSYTIPRLRFRGPRTGRRPKAPFSGITSIHWSAAQRASYCLKTEANRASMYLYNKACR